MIPRRKTRQVKVGTVLIGGDAPVSVQSMTSGYTHDIDKCVAEIHKLADGGADIVRVAVPERKDTEALKEILKQVNASPSSPTSTSTSNGPWKPSRPASTKSASTPATSHDRAQVEKVIDACKERGIPIRVGVNEGSIVERKDKQKRLKELGGVFSNNKHGHFLAIMIAKLEEYLDIFYARNFYDIAISAKSIDPAAGHRRL